MRDESGLYLLRVSIRVKKKPYCLRDFKNIIDAFNEVNGDEMEINIVKAHRVTEDGRTIIREICPVSLTLENLPWIKRPTQGPESIKTKGGNGR